MVRGGAGRGRVLDEYSVERVLRFLEDAKEAIRAARAVTGESLDVFLRDIRLRFALRYALVQLVESLAAALAPWLEYSCDRAPETYRQVFMLAAECGILPADVARVLAALASLRNMLVHRYWSVDDERLFRETRASLEVAERAVEWLRRLVGYQRAAGGEEAEHEDPAGGEGEGSPRSP